MGIKGLTQLIKKHSKESIVHSKLYKLSGKTIAIDASLFIYQSLIMYRYDNDFIKNKEGKNISHILGIFNKTVNYLSYNITPIYIFDGIPPKEKSCVLKERRMKVENAKNELNSSNTDPANIEKLNKQTIRLTSDIINDVKHILNLLGVSYIDSPGEAEGYASELCRIKYVDYVVSEDMDCIPFGCTNLVRNCIDKNLKKTDTISIINKPQLLTDLELTDDEFIELCILCGCDYCNNIPRIGSMTAYKIIKKHKTIEKYLDTQKDNKNIPDGYKESYLKAKKLFMIFNNVIDINNMNKNDSNLDIAKLKKYLIEYCVMSDTKIKKSLNKIQNKYIKE